MAVGLVSSAGVMAAGLVAGLEPGVPALLLAQPALWSVPLAFVTMIVVSLRGSPPVGGGVGHAAAAPRRDGADGAPVLTGAGCYGSDLRRGRRARTAAGSHGCTVMFGAIR